MCISISTVIRALALPFTRCPSSVRSRPAVSATPRAGVESLAPNRADRPTRKPAPSASWQTWRGALIDVAIRGDLARSDVLEAQVRRMLADERARSLVDSFAAQWPYPRNLEAVIPDMRLFPDFDDNLRQAMRQETELFFERILREDRSVLELIKADYTYLNERLAK